MTTKSYWLSLVVVPLQHFRPTLLPTFSIMFHRSLSEGIFKTQIQESNFQNIHAKIHSMDFIWCLPNTAHALLYSAGAATTTQQTEQRCCGGAGRDTLYLAVRCSQYDFNRLICVLCHEYLKPSKVDTNVKTRKWGKVLTWVGVWLFLGHH